MKLARAGKRGEETPCFVVDGAVLDATPWFNDWDHAFLENGGVAEAASRLKSEGAGRLETLPPNTRLGPCIPRPGKIVCIGLNYSDHAEETGGEVPAEPIVFLKSPTSLNGPFDPVVIPRGSTHTDWEVELGVVVGKTARSLDTPASSAQHIAGYCIANDVSERAFQTKHCGQWTKGKSCDTFCPLGPWLVTPEETGDIGSLDLTLDVNGARMQTGNTSKMIFGIDFLIHYVSKFMTLEAGDVILTGTPPGVGMGRRPRRFLQPGDFVEAAISGLGVQNFRCIAG